MGLAGPIPKLKLHNPAKLTELNPPEWLCDYAKEFFLKHCELLAKNELLNANTVDSFYLLCDLWGRVRALAGENTSRTYLDAVKSYHTLAKLFRLVPCDKPGQTDNGRFDSKGDFEF